MHSVKPYRVVFRRIASFAILFIGFASPQLVAQGSEDSEYIIEEFTLPGGQFANNVNSIAEGPYGFLWFGTHGGLIRYDGNEFITYKAEKGDTLTPTTSLTFQYVEHLYWDQFDKLWVSTYGDGIFRFDPITETFDHFPHDPYDSTSISHPRITWGTEDAEGRLWFTTEHGINRFDRDTETFKRYYPFDGPENLIDNMFRNIYLDKSDNLWFSGGNAPWRPAISGFLKYNYETDTFKKFVHDANDPKSISSSSTRGLIEDSQGNFWVGNIHGLYRMDRENETFEYYGYNESSPYAPGEESGTSKLPFSFMEDSNGLLWIGAIVQSERANNIVVYNPENRTVQNLPLKHAAWQLFQSSDGTIWVPGAGLSGRMSRITRKTKTYYFSKGDIYESEYNLVRNEINRGRDPLDPEFLSGSGPTTFGFDRKTGMMWGTHVGSTNRTRTHISVLSAYDPKTGDIKFYHLPEIEVQRNNTLAGNQFHFVGIEVDKYGRIWGSYPSENVGLFRFDPSNNEVIQFLHDPLDTNSISTNYLVDIYMDNKLENLYVSTYHEGLNRVDVESGKITRIDISNPSLGIIGNFPITTVEDHDGFIWIGGEIENDKQYLVKLDPKDNSLEYHDLAMGAGQYIRDLALDPNGDGLAFVVFNHGLGYYGFKSSYFSLFNTSLGNIAKDDTRKVLFDQNGLTWASTSEGSFIRMTENSSVDYFHKNNGFESIFRDGAIAPDGRLYFNSSGSWDVIDPSEVNQTAQHKNTQVQLVDLYVLGEKQTPGKGKLLEKPIWATDKIVLDHQDENFALRFSDFNFQNNSTFQYRLFPYEENWINSDNDPLASYFDIPEGQYEFQVKSLHEANNLKGELLTLDVVILPPWWRTWWAYVIYALIGSLLLWYVMKVQRDRAVRMERERNQERELVQARKLEVAYNKLKESEREAQIEASLERVRAASIAMQKSEELPNVLSVMLREFGLFNNSDELRDIEIFIIDEDTGEATAWTSDQNFQNGVTSYPFSFFVTPEMKNEFLQWKKTPLHERIDLIINSHYNHEAFENVLTNFDKVEELKPISKRFRDQGVKEWATHHAYFSHGLLALQQQNRLPEGQIDILIRFAKVFEQSYTRFLDLLKAEAQAREAQIETALEKVRSAGMAMHSSEDLLTASEVLFDQLKAIQLNAISCSITLVDSNKDAMELWVTHDNEFSIKKVKASDHPNFKEEIDAWKSGIEELKLTNPKEDFIRSVKDIFDFNVTDRKDRNDIHLLHVRHQFGWITLGTWDEVIQQDVEICRRFAAVFEQTYTRFLDLQRAEAQAREAQIEAALERVRAKAMTMQSSDQIGEVLGKMLEELTLLDMALTRVIIWVFHSETKTSTWWGGHPEIKSIAKAYKIDYKNDHAFFRMYIENWQKRTPLFIYTLKGQEKTTWDNVLFEETELRSLPKTVIDGMKEPEAVILTNSFNEFGVLMTGSKDELSKDNKEIIQRFNALFEQTYRRFLDVQEAEKRAREAQIEAALERVRSRAMAMHNSDELAEAAELLYSEFNKLGVTPFSCGYVINDNEKGEWKVWMTDSGEENFKDFWTLPFDADSHLMSRYESWENGEPFHESVLVGDVNLEHHKVIAKYAPWKEAILDSLPPKLVLSCANFKNGHLLIIRDEVLEPEIKQILIRFAKVFEQTYTRFLDLKTAEEQALLIKQEKERLEQTLTELKATQSQLVQAEKMASLGELTAGIAHEIKNPLNFVNNFSEVSGELLEEMEEEIKDGNYEEVNEIISDLKQNLEKIHHHGARADSIVKGMLEHSRTSTGERKETEINALVDEYLKLAYHGLRAKDKSFNAQIITDYEKSLDKIHVVPQEIGRVILNLITNAFYVVYQKSKNLNGVYDPKVIVKTKDLKDQLEVSVTDNGDGVPEEIKNKIFQPFFTTKPTGEGTGFGPFFIIRYCKST